MLEVLAWPKATNLLVRRLVCKDRHKDSLRLPKMPWQGHLAWLQPPKPSAWLAGLAGSGNGSYWQLLLARHACSMPGQCRFKQQLYYVG